MAIGVGVVLAVGVPVGWSLLASGDEPADVGAGTAVSLAGPVDPTDAVTGSSSTTTVRATTAPGTASSAPGATSSAPGTTRTAPDTARTPPSSTRAPSTGRSTPAPAAPSPAPSSIPIADGDPAVAAAPDRTRVPTRLQIPDLSVDATVVPVGVDTRGDLAIPEDVDTVGWYRFGPAPGAASGSVVLAGHVDSATQGVGAMRAMWSAAPGMTVTVSSGDGAPVRYRVVSREIFVKGQVPLASLFSTGGSARLTLITCGGPFDEQTRSYVDNVVVTAVPA